MSEAPIHRVRLADVVAQPWKNGGGITRELLAWPSAHDWLVRLSVADIARDGPFSAFPGVTRHFAVLSGTGVVLEGIGALAVSDPPAMFDGDRPRDCRLLDGPTRDLNLMIRRDAGHGQLQRIAERGETIAAPGAAIHGIFNVEDAELSWTVGARGLALSSTGTPQAAAFHFAFFTKDASQ